MSSPDWTIGRLLTWTADYLKQHGSDSPRLDAEVLLAHVRNCPRIMLYTAFDEIAAESVRTAYRDLVKRRAEGTPVAYLVGKREFYSLSFAVTPAVLIPRPETEHLVVRLLDLLKGRDSAEVADVGTGSGIIAIAVAKHAPHCRITAIDNSPAALAVAQSNAATHGVTDRIEFIESDLFTGLSAERRFDYIASNPPYIGAAEMPRLALSVRDHEPNLALEAGPLGTEVIERLIPQATHHLNVGGWLLIEVSPMIETAARKLLSAEPSLTVGPTLKDLAGLPRVLQAQRI